MIQKDTALRCHLKKLRKGLSVKRRQEAADKLLKEMIGRLDQARLVLSYASHGSELNTDKLNKRLCEEGRLALPRVIAGGALALYKVNSLSNGLVKSASFGVLEPIPQVCEEVAHKAIDTVIVPGLGFDDHGHRVGYGFGFYDRLLKELACISFGVGFIEQHLETLIAIDAHDVALDTVLYY